MIKLPPFYFHFRICDAQSVLSYNNITKLKADCLTPILARASDFLLTRLTRWTIVPPTVSVIILKPSHTSCLLSCGETRVNTPCCGYADRDSMYMYYTVYNDISIQLWFSWSGRPSVSWVGPSQNSGNNMHIDSAWCMLRPATEYTNAMQKTLLRF